LTASIAHEVNQPLSGIITNAGTCLRMLDANPPNIDGARETATRTIRDGNRASDVITRLRALFSKKEFSLESVDLNEATREVITLSRSELQRNQVVLQSELADDLPNVTGDRVQLQQVILNLLHNAMEALADEDASPRAVCVTCRDDCQTVTVCVRDSGPGLRAGTEEAVFEPFYTTKSGGMGMGLSIVRSIVEAHGGSIRARNAQDGGAVVEFQLPLASAIPTD
jgi:C4-dicarboxylate-specific signal transduction histidine kinase